MATVKQIKSNNTLVKETIVKRYPIYFNEDSDEEVFTIKEVLNTLSSFGEEDREKIRISYKNKTSIIGFESIPLPYCCGVIEIGNLQCSNNIELKDLQELIDGLPILSKGKTLIMNTNGQQPSVMFEKVLPKCKNWVLVKTFKNNGRNTIKMWVSNND